MKTLIFDELKKYVEDDVIRYDVPGHKGNYFDNDFVKYYGKNIVKADVNSMQRLDNLNFSQTIIKESQLNIAKLHKAKDARFLVNGTTQGIQVMILSSLKPNDKILVPINIHKSVQSAIILSGAIPIYLNVEVDSKLMIYTKLTLDEVEQKIKLHNDIKAALLINPSYYGVSNEFSQIVTTLKNNNILTLVDEAHGGSYYFLEDKVTAMEAGADMSCISYHKTLGSLTQTSLLLYNSEHVSVEQLDEAYTLLNTTSPSYLFMANLEVTIFDLFTNKHELFAKQIQELQKYKEEINKIKGIKVLEPKDLNLRSRYFDSQRLVIDLSDLSISGFKVYEVLRDKYNIQVELGEFKTILCIVSIFDDLSNLKKLIESLKKISKKYYIIKRDEKKISLKFLKQKNFLPLRDIYYANKQLIDLEEAVGKVLAENIMLYPPGISLMLPGEKITSDFVNYINTLQRENIIIYGLHEGKVNIIKEGE